VVKDIDSARGELKRAVIDLPEETRSNADAMRKVVADQISALNALSEVVRRQAGTQDFSGPGYLTPRGSGPGGSSGKSEGASFSAPLSGTTSTRNDTSERNTKVTSGGVEGTLAQIAASVEALSGSKPAPRRKSVGAETAGLPAQAAREIATYSQKLNASAREVVEAMDDGLPRDLEKRFSAGEADIYTKRLHENRGRKVIAGMKTRYGSERLLRSRINAYVRLFEKLLDTLNDVPNGSATIDAVLGSQSGEVYVMLAEAAGRIEEK
jgi:hypothetical protein